MSRQHILLVEDDQELARLVMDYLHSEDYTVVSCSNTLKAKKLLATQGFDLMICDVMLPGSSGFELVQQIRSQFKGPILFMTAQTTVTAQLHGLELGAQDYLLKPIDEKRLLEAILKYESIIGKQQSRPENNLQLILESLQLFLF